MSAVTGIIAGAAILVGAVAATRVIEKRTRRFRQSLREAMRQADGADQNGAPNAPLIIDLEKDPVSGAYRQKPSAARDGASAQRG